MQRVGKKCCNTECTLKAKGDFLDKIARWRKAWSLIPCEAQAERVVRSSLVVEVSEVEVYGVCGVCGVRHRSRLRREGWEEAVGIDRHVATNSLFLLG